MKEIPSSELILTPEGAVYHLGLFPEQMCSNVITVGDPERVDKIGDRLDRIFYRHQVREFCTIGGEIDGHQMMIVSTGIGTDNIDIVLNELDALVNIDFNTRTSKVEKKSLNIFRIGTSGSLRKEIEIDSILVSEYSLGMDGLLHYYQRKMSSEIDVLEQKFNHFLQQHLPKITSYANKNGLPDFLSSLPSEIHRGCTLTAPGFYGPQGRELNGKLINKDYLDALRSFNHNGIVVTNFEMETSGIYGIADVLGHKAVSINGILANRASNTFSTDVSNTVNKLIDFSLDAILKYL